MDRFDFMKQLQDRIKELEAECLTVSKEIGYHTARSAAALGFFKFETGAVCCRDSCSANTTALDGSAAYWSFRAQEHVQKPILAPTDETLEFLAVELGETMSRLSRLQAYLEKAKAENVVDKIKELMNEN